MELTNKKQSIALGILLFLGGFILFHFWGNFIRGYINTTSLFTWWSFQWFNPGSETEHGSLILLIALWFFIRSLRQSTGEKESSQITLGLILVFCALALHFLGALLYHTRISIIAFLIYCVACSFIIWGKRGGRASIFPALLMLFTIPLQVFYDELGFHLRLAVIKATYVVADGVGFEVIRNGTHLSSAQGTYQYDVAPACSGMRSLLALLSLTLIVGYLSLSKIWARVFLFALAIGFAFLGNLVRLFTIILVAEWFGSDAGTAVHDYGGIIVFACVLGLSLLTVTLLQKYNPELSLKIDPPPEEPNKAFWQSTLSLPSARYTVLITILGISLFTTGVLVNKVAHLNTPNACGVVLDADQINPQALPTNLDYEWLGKAVSVSEVERTTLPEDTGYARALYKNIKGNQVYLSIVLSGKDRTSIHRPELCLVGQGWTIIEKTPLTITTASTQTLETTLLKIERENEQGERVLGYFVYYFIAEGKTAATHIERIAIGLKDRVFHFKNHRWAYVFGQAVIRNDEKETLQSVQDVIRLAFPSIRKTKNQNEGKS